MCLDVRPSPARSNADLRRGIVRSSIRRTWENPLGKMPGWRGDDSGSSGPEPVAACRPRPETAVSGSPVLPADLSGASPGSAAWSIGQAAWLGVGSRTRRRKARPRTPKAPAASGRRSACHSLGTRPSSACRAAAPVRRPRAWGRPAGPDPSAASRSSPERSGRRRPARSPP